MKRSSAFGEESSKHHKRDNFDRIHSSRRESETRYDRRDSNPNGAPHYHASSKTSYSVPSLKALHVYPISQFDDKFPYFRQPKEVGGFSQDYKQTFKDDSSQLKCYCPPLCSENVSFGLRKGYDVFIKRDDSIKEYINDLLRWILKHRKVFSLHDQTNDDQPFRLSTDFISWRGLYTKLLCTPYENREGWKIAVTKHKDTYYMCEFTTEEKLEQQKHDTDRQKEMTYWGVKFEQYVTAEPGQSPVTNKPVNNHEAFCSVVRSRLNQHSLVLGGETDCYEEVDGKRTYVELKTSREIEHPRQLINFKRFKAIKWWAQSFMVGIEKIVCGFRDDDGVVHRLEDFNTQNLPKYCKDIKNCWEPNICFNFVDRFLQHVKDTVREDDPHIVYMFEWRPREHIECRQYTSGSEYNFLPDWYIEATT